MPLRQLGESPAPYARLATIRQVAVTTSTGLVLALPLAVAAHCIICRHMMQRRRWTQPPIRI